MNEQEQIKGITRLLEETHGICGNFSGCTNRKCSQCYAEALYDAGYRKADEVREETAEKILSEIVGHTFEDDGWTWTVSIEDVQWLAEKYKVKIKE